MKENTHIDINEDDTQIIHEHEDGHIHTEAHTHSHPHTHTHKETKAVLNRMARITGHMNAVKNMVESGRDCSEVLIQLSAIEASIKSLSRVILKDHISTCMVDAIKSGDETALDDLMEAIDKLMKQ